MEIQSKKNQVYRMRPRENKDVNGYWSCDEGRLNYKFVNSDRLEKPFIRRGSDVFECTVEEAIAEMRTLLGFKPAGPVDGPATKKAVVLLSATASLEEMFLFRQLAVILNAPVFAARHIPNSVDDRLLRRADRHPNATGAQMLGIRLLNLQTGGGDNGDAVTHALGLDGVLIAVGFNTDVKALEGIVAKTKTVVALAGCKNALTERADLVIPGLTFADKEG